MTVPSTSVSRSRESRTPLLTEVWRHAAGGVRRVLASEHVMQEVIVPHRQLRQRMLGLPAEMVREAWSLEVREERGVVRPPEDSPIQQQMKECAPPGGIPFALEERALRVEGVARKHPLDASARMHGKAKHPYHHPDEALGHTSVQHARGNRRAVRVPIRERRGREVRAQVLVRSEARRPSAGCRPEERERLRV